MTNREHYSEQIIDICAKSGRPIIYTDGLTGCCSHDCSGCHNWYKQHGIFGACFLCKAQEHFSKWLEEEYEPTVNWSKVPVDTQILVKNECGSGRWIKRHFAYYQDGEVYAWKNGKTSYTSQQDPPSVWKYAKLYKQETEQMTGHEYQLLAARTINKDLTNKGCEMHALHGMVGEIGELHSLYQKKYQGHEFDRHHAMSEISDLLWFIAEYCSAVGLNLDDVMQYNIDKLIARYPDGFSKEKSLHRSEGDI